MKQKIIIALLCLVSLVNAGLIYMLWSQQQVNSRNIGFLENKVDRLDIDALENIKSEKTDEIDCSSSTSGDWLHSAFCN